MRTTHILILLLVAAGAVWLTTWVDNGLGVCWTHNVVRNWEQFGFFNLHGKLVSNPGGFEAVTNPDVYAGHRAVSLYPVFFLYHVLGAGKWGIFVYYALLAIMVAGSIWQLLGKTERAFWLADIVVLTPGYIRWQTTIDPNLVAVLFGFPFSAAVIALLSRPVLTGKHWTILVLVVLLFSALNWTTVFVDATLFVTLLVLGRIPLRRLVIFAGLTAVLAGAVVLVSVASKAGEHAGAGGGLAKLLRSYGWGNEGYGLDLSTTTACLRLLAVNLMGLLPVLVLLGWQLWQDRGQRVQGGLIFLLPALVPVVEVLGMRNYFGHHPWMSVHFILLGIMLAAVAWRARVAAAPAEKIETRLPPALGAGGLAVTLLYGAMVMAMTYANTERETNLIVLVREHSARPATIVIARDTDPDLAAIELRLPELIDRRIVVIPTISDVATVPAPRVVLTAVRPAPGGVVAETSQAGNGPVLNKLIGWYSHYIAHRRAGDKLEIGDKYFLGQAVE